MVFQFFYPKRGFPKFGGAVKLRLRRTQVPYLIWEIPGNRGTRRRVTLIFGARAPNIFFRQSLFEKPKKLSGWEQKAPGCSPNDILLCVTRKITPFFWDIYSTLPPGYTTGFNDFKVFFPFPQGFTHFLREGVFHHRLVKVYIPPYEELMLSPPGGKFGPTL